MFTTTSYQVENNFVVIYMLRRGYLWFKTQESGYLF